MKRKIILWLLGLLGEHKTQKNVIVIEVDAEQALKELEDIKERLQTIRGLQNKITIKGKDLYTTIMRNDK